MQQLQFQLSWLFCHQTAAMLHSRFLTTEDTTASSLQVGGVSDTADVISLDQASGLRYTRDAGYVGIVGEKTFQMNFDTLLCNNDLTDCPSFVGSNSFSYLDNETGAVTDPPDAINLCGVNTQTGFDESVWLTNTIPLDSTHGVAWFLNHTNDSGEPGVNMGVGLVDVSSDTPVCNRLVDSLVTASDAPTWGFHGAILSQDNDGYAYLYGSDMSTAKTLGGWGTVYLARVQPSMAATLQAYQYWDGEDFVSSASSAAPIMNETVPGSVSYSDYHGAYVYLYPSDPFGAILGRIAPSPQGPWSSPTTIFQGGLYYSPQVLPLAGTGGSVKLMYSTESTTSQYYQKTIEVTWG